MVFKSTGGKWILCPGCQIIIFTESRRKHKCPPKVRQVIEEQVQEFVDEEMVMFDKNLEGFWKAPDVKFYKYLLEKDQE